MIICLFGPSCGGKTTVGRRAAAVLQLPLRSIGKAVRQMAETLGLPIDQLSDDAHRAVDAASVAWALERRSGCMLEGRFLDAVFATAGVPATLIELREARGCRAERARTRNDQPNFSTDDLDRLDAEDASFRRRLFGCVGSDAPRHVLNTSGLEVEECAQRVKQIIEASGVRRQSPRA
jgi:cytidylate kinase